MLKAGVKQLVLSICWKNKINEEFGYHIYSNVTHDPRRIWLLRLHDYAHSKNAAHLNYLVGGLVKFIQVSGSLQSYELTWSLGMMII